MKRQNYSLLSGLLVLISGAIVAMNPQDDRPRVPLKVYTQLGINPDAAPYKILGVRGLASRSEIEKAYKQHLCEWQTDETKDAFKLIEWAYKKKIDSLTPEYSLHALKLIFKVSMENTIDAILNKKDFLLAPAILSKNLTTALEHLKFINDAIRDKKERAEYKKELSELIKDRHYQERISRLEKDPQFADEYPRLLDEINQLNRNISQM